MAKIFIRKYFLRKLKSKAKIQNRTEVKKSALYLTIIDLLGQPYEYELMINYPNGSESQSIVASFLEQPPRTYYEHNLNCCWRPI